MLRLSLYSLFLSASLMAANVSVPAGGDLQAALNQAKGGDTITLAANATFTGHYTLAANPSGAWITIQSSALAQLPGTGQRLSSTQSSLLPKLATPDANAVLVIPGGANFYRFVGIEFETNPAVYVQDLIQAGTAQETTAAALPHDLDFDRVYVHAFLPIGGKRGLALNSGKATVENSYFENFVSDWQDTQAIEGWNGTGPFVIQNNWLQSGTEIVAFGGATPAIQGLIPSDIVVQNNDFFKPTCWWDGDPCHTGPHIRAKNHLELKNAQRVTIQNNTFTNNMIGADQSGFTMLLNVRDEGGTVPWATVSNVLVQNNIFHHIAGGVLLMGHDGDGGGTAHDLTVKNNLFYDMGVMGGDGSWAEVISGVQNSVLDHNTAFPSGWLVVFAGTPSANVNFTNNILTHGGGPAGDGGVHGEPAFAQFDPSGQFANNLVIDAQTNLYQGPHFSNLTFVNGIGNVGFTNLVGANFALTANSSFAKLGDGAQTSAVTGQLNNPAPLPSPNPVPIPTPPPPSQPPPAALPTGWTSIVSKNSKKCLDVKSTTGNQHGTLPGTLVQQWTCTGGDNQQFQLTPVPGGYEITVKQSGLQLDVQGGPSATGDGVPLIEWKYWGGANEIFQVNPTPDGFYHIHPVSSGKCVDVSNVSMADGAAVWQWTCLGTDNQKWSFHP